MKVGFDIDGVLTNNKSWFNAVTKKFGFKYDDIKDEYKLPITSQQYQELYDEYGDYIFREAEVEQGAMNTVRDIAKRHDIYFITARPESSADITLKWLKDHGFPIKDNIIYNHDKVAACKELGVTIMIEDNAESAIKLADEGILTYLITRPYNAKVNTESDFIVRFSSMGDQLKYLFMAGEFLMGIPVPEVSKKARKLH
jgi:HAD superfamily hydrolase (TIGR01549 family)